MNKQEFLSQLREAFAKYEIPDTKSEKYFKKFEKLIDSVEEKDQEAKIKELGDPEEIAKKAKELIDEKKQKKIKIKEEEAVPVSDAEDEIVKERNSVESMRGKYIFIAGIVLTSPIWLGVFAALALLFLTFYTVMILIDIVIGIVLSASIIVGGIASASSIIYGIIALLPGSVASYIGMYELGLGLMILGILIVSGILLHFFVIKVTPLVFRSTTKLIKFTIKQFIKLFKFIRKECYKI